METTSAAEEAPVSAARRLFAPTRRVPALPQSLSALRAAHAAETAATTSGKLGRVSSAPAPLRRTKPGASSPSSPPPLVYTSATAKVRFQATPPRASDSDSSLSSPLALTSSSPSGTGGAAAAAAPAVAPGPGDDDSDFDDPEITALADFLDTDVLYAALGMTTLPAEKATGATATTAAAASASPVATARRGAKKRKARAVAPRKPAGAAGSTARKRPRASTGKKSHTPQQDRQVNAPAARMPAESAAAAAATACAAASTELVCGSAAAAAAADDTYLSELARIARAESVKEMVCVAVRARSDFATAAQWQCAVGHYEAFIRQLVNAAACIAADAQAQMLAAPTPGANPACIRALAAVKDRIAVLRALLH